STSWPMVTRPTYIGGLGFTMKWNMGWMHDTLFYFSRDPIYRKYHTNAITFSLLYAFSENFVLPLSHDEVVYGKGSLFQKMPGDRWQKLANLRALFGYMYGHPGKKLLFMGSEFGQINEWNWNWQLEWNLLSDNAHRGLSKFIRDLNTIYKNEKALYEIDFHWRGFQWIDFSDHDQSIISFLRKAENDNDFLLFVFNLTPVPRFNYRIGFPKAGFY
ncbi:MAG: alpha amylase C-terminal domain-containing protein, partial [bacterium]|nr:alpha amylase C-terminal domain-containing protein [bacterium]